jgi:hypothetical protein
MAGTTKNKLISHTRHSPIFSIFSNYTFLGSTFGEVWLSPFLPSFLGLFRLQGAKTGRRYRVALSFFNPNHEDDYNEHDDSDGRAEETERLGLPQRYLCRGQLWLAGGLPQVRRAETRGHRRPTTRQRWCRAAEGGRLGLSQRGL